MPRELQALIPGLIGTIAGLVAIAAYTSPLSYKVGVSLLITGAYVSTLGAMYPSALCLTRSK